LANQEGEEEEDNP